MILTIKGILNKGMTMDATSPIFSTMLMLCLYGI
jgi:hypothetical protein